MFKVHTIRAMRSAAAILIGVLVGAGCAGSSMPRGLESPAPGERTRALADPDLMEDESTIPARIEALDSDDPLVRLVAIRSLERMTGRTLGYDHASAEAERKLAAARWRAWYEGERSGVADSSGASSDSEEP